MYVSTLMTCVPSVTVTCIPGHHIEGNHLQQAPCHVVEGMRGKHGICLFALHIYRDFFGVGFEQW